MDIGISNRVANHLAVPAIAHLGDAIFVVARRGNTPGHRLRRGRHADDNRRTGGCVELEHSLLVIVAMQHELGAGLLEDAHRRSRIAQTPPPVHLSGKGRVMDKHHAKQAGAAKLLQGEFQEGALRRAETACRDEGHGGDSGGKRHERHIAETAHEGEGGRRRADQRFSGLIGLHEGAPMAGSRAPDAAAHRRRGCRGSR